MGDDEQHIICRKFNLTLISAENLPNVRNHFENRVQAKVTIGGDKHTERETKSDRQNGLNPAWNCRFRYIIAESGIIHQGLSVVITLFSKRTLGDRYIGEVNTSLKELFDRGSATLALPIKKGAAPTSAVLNFSYCFGESVAMEKPALWKKVLAAGARIIIRGTLLAVIGMDIEIPFYVDDEIIDGECDSSK